MGALESALAALARWLDDAAIPYMVIGGFANLVWGEPRLTRDLDVTVSVPPDALAETIRRMTSRFPPRVPDPAGFVRETRVLPVTVGSIPTDIIFAALPYEELAIARAIPIEIEGSRVAVCSPEDLILHKLVSPRPRDADDVVGIFRARGKQLDLKYLGPRVEELASVLERRELRDLYDELKRKFCAP